MRQAGTVSATRLRAASSLLASSSSPRPSPLLPSLSSLTNRHNEPPSSGAVTRFELSPFHLYHDFALFSSSPVRVYYFVIIPIVYTSPRLWPVIIIICIYLPFSHRALDETYSIRFQLATKTTLQIRGYASALLIRYPII